ncbi:malto-oligosyltrehalose synthase [Salinactinospora qingdaonensis]|uniref:Malto-oligosyltrehalose synthase n=1 Tax=Salinactinospora qingdaonensis TaxID=702744 RepID=A0ABP7FLP7_9ACTN
MASHTPTSVYRLQVGPGFTLTDAAATVDYLHRLGVGAAYLSPILTAAPGSTHGYDVVDPTEVSPPLGGEPARRELAATLSGHGMGLVVDIVPNHMSVAVPAANPWWWDVLRHGPQSPYARFFDIDFEAGPLLVPVLADDGDGGAAALAELSLDGEQLAYHEHRFPLAPGTRHSGDDADAVHQRQHYRLVSWRRGTAELNYRRFFDISDLAAVRVEDPEVFAATHAEILRWADAGELTGLRVDHPDGLTDPGGYVRRLRAAFDGWIVVEKILGAEEALPASWPVDGTTGYDALREVCGVFIDPAGEQPLTRLAAAMGTDPDFERVEADSRAEVAETTLVAEVRRIAALLPDIPAERARPAVAALLAVFPVYRSYLPEGMSWWQQAVCEASRRAPDYVDVLAAIDHRVHAEPAGDLARRIQQTSGMVVAKGTEDTAFYRHTRFIALNEVGGAPERFGLDVAGFHERAALREAAWPHSMTTLSTHDTKRSEDVRARLAVLSEIPEDFGAAVRRWTGRCGIEEPALNLLAWQTLVGVWPISEPRLRGYLEKAAKESGLRTSWTDPDPRFEEHVRSWPERVLDDADLSADVAAFVARIRDAGWSNALGQKLVQLTEPGIPDVYQGSELWELSLVDPDNRRPVDFTVREALLERLEHGWRPDVDVSGAAKLHVIRQALHLRASRPLTGYRPLTPVGPAAEHALAFARGERWEVVTIATRLPLGLAASGGWRDTAVPLPAGSGGWSDLLTGRALAPTQEYEPTLAFLGEVLDRYPVALLVRR